MKWNSLFALCLTMSLYASFAQAEEPYNYYLPAPNHLLDTAEKAHLTQGIEKAKQGKYEFAWGEFATILHYFPNHPKALQQICELSLQMERPERAKKYFERAIKTFPEQPQTYAQYGVFLEKIGQPRLAITQYQQALALDMMSGETYYRLSRSYLALDDIELAKKAARMAEKFGYPVANNTED